MVLPWEEELLECKILNNSKHKQRSRWQNSQAHFAVSCLHLLSQYALLWSHMVDERVCYRAARTSTHFASDCVFLCAFLVPKTRTSPSPGVMQALVLQVTHTKHTHIAHTQTALCGHLLVPYMYLCKIHSRSSWWLQSMMPFRGVLT